METPNCYSCIKHPVCKFFGKWIDHFPYKSDQHIRAYLDGISETLATACAQYLTKEEK